MGLETGTGLFKHKGSENKDGEVLQLQEGE